MTQQSKLYVAFVIDYREAHYLVGVFESQHKASEVCLKDWQDRFGSENAPLSWEDHSESLVVGRPFWGRNAWIKHYAIIRCEHSRLESGEMNNGIPGWYAVITEWDE